MRINTWPPEQLSCFRLELLLENGYTRVRIASVMTNKDLSIPVDTPDTDSTSAEERASPKTSSGQDISADIADSPTG